ncbi:hypothetical protein ACFWGG_33335, partial [Streptomyces roseolus]
WQDRGRLIKGYDAGPLVSDESLLVRPGFWSNYLLAMCSDGGVPSARFRSGSAMTAPMSTPCPSGCHGAADAIEVGRLEHRALSPA